VTRSALPRVRSGAWLLFARRFARLGVAILAGSYRELFGPGLLGGFTPLRRIFGSGVVSGGVAGLLAGPALLDGPLVLVSPFVGAAAGGPGAVLLVAVLAPFAAAVRAGPEALASTPGVRVRTFARRLDRLERRLAALPLGIRTIARREQEVTGQRDALLVGVSSADDPALADLTSRVSALAEQEHDRAVAYLAGPEAATEAAGILGDPSGVPLVYVLERRGWQRADAAYALAVQVHLRRSAIASGAHGTVLLVEAPWSLVGRVEQDGWTPRGGPAGPVGDEERETMVSLWAGGESEVYADAAVLLEAARRL